MSSRPRPLTKAHLEALTEFRYQMRRFECLSARAAQREGITSRQFLMLLRVKGLPGRTWESVDGLVERLQMQSRGAIALVARYVALGLVERRPNASERRQVEVHLLGKAGPLLHCLAALHRPKRRSLSSGFRVSNVDLLVVQ